MTPVQVASRTDIGRRRNLNEDSLLVGRHVWAVADGMGGHAAGDIASALVVDRLRELDEMDPIEPSDVIATIKRANADVLGYGQRHPDSWGLGSTVSGLCRVTVAGAPHWAIFNVGDSRVYRVWQGDLARATVDHSETEELILGGRITEAEARNHPLRNVITRSIGSPTTPQVDLWVMPRTGGERFLICSDGLTSELEDEAIRRVVATEQDPQRAVDLLIEGVLDAGAADNVTIIIVDVAGQSGEVDETTNPRPDR